MIDLNDVLLAMSNIPVDDPIAEIWGRQMQGGYKIIEYTGSLPITISANGDALLDYRIYGTDGGVGEPTENLFDGYGTENYGYYNNDTGLYVYDRHRKYWRIPVSEGDVVRTNGVEQGYGCSYYKGERVARVYPFTKYIVPAGVDELTNNVKVIYSHDLIVTKNHEIPANYIPYGYKLPMTVQSANLLNSKITDVEQKVKIEPNTEYVLSRYAGLGGNRMYWAIYNESDVKIYGEDFMLYATAMRVPPRSDASYIKITIPGIAYDAVSIVKDTFINTSTAVPSSYIPYSRTNTPVYIGENQLDSVEDVADYVDKSSGKIVRTIGEYTFTGDESFNKYGNSDVFYTSKTIDPVGITTVNTVTMRCDHSAFTAIENKDTRYWLNPEADNICCFLPGGMSQVFLRSTSNFTTATECKAYLKAQYDNGTPVKISYWLKVPIEEDPPVPLPKIPTIDGTTVIDCELADKPSQMYIKYKGKG